MQQQANCKTANQEVCQQHSGGGGFDQNQKQDQKLQLPIKDNSDQGGHFSDQISFQFLRVAKLELMVI